MTQLSNAELAQRLTTTIEGWQDFVDQQLAWLTSENDTVTIVHPYTNEQLTAQTLYKLVTDYEDILGPNPARVEAIEQYIQDFAGFEATLIGLKDDAETAKDAAVVAESNAQSAATAASTSETNAASSASAAQASETAAGTSATSAATSASEAASSATAAAQSETNAATSAAEALASESTVAADAQAAEDAKIAAESVESNVQTSATAAATSASEAATSASEAATSATEAATSASEAQTAESNADASEQNAQTFASQAENEATAASTSASNAASSASAAEASETAASSSASAAATSEANASTSESNALASEQAAESSANAAAASETAADVAKTAAEAAEIDAEAFATSAEDSANAAEASATAAEDAQDAAETAESSAADSATDASNSASAAATSETNAASSEALAQQWANEDYNVEVEPGEYSAYHWAVQAQANSSGLGSTDDLVEGTNNLYWIEAPEDGQQYVRINGTWAAVNIPAGYTTSDFDTDFSVKTTDDLAEGSSNLYWIEAPSDGQQYVRVNDTWSALSLSSADITDFTSASSSAAPVQSVNTQTGAVVLTKTDVGLSDVDNVSATDLRDRSTHTGTQAATTVTYDNTASGLVATDVKGAVDELQSAKVAQTDATGSAEIPSGTQAQRDATPSAGFFRFNTDTSQFEGYNGAEWGEIGGGGGATGGGGDQVFLENDQEITTDYTIPVGKNAVSVGPLDVNSGANVTVSNGSRWVVL